MKKILTICMLALSCLLFASCDGGKPEFKFSLNLTGEVTNAPTAIAGNFIVDVANDVVPVPCIFTVHTTASKHISLTCENPNRV